LSLPDYGTQRARKPLLGSPRGLSKQDPRELTSGSNQLTAVTASGKPGLWHTVALDVHRWVSPSITQ